MSCAVVRSLPIFFCVQRAGVRTPEMLGAVCMQSSSNDGLGRGVGSLLPLFLVSSGAVQAGEGARKRELAAYALEAFSARRAQAFPPLHQHVEKRKDAVADAVAALLRRSVGVDRRQRVVTCGQRYEKHERHRPHAHGEKGRNVRKAVVDAAKVHEP